MTHLEARLDLGLPRSRRPAARRWLIALAVGLLLTACRSSPTGPLHRERAATRDSGCTDPERPSAYFYPAKNRTDYGPDDPKQDGCVLLVADHLFCCPRAPRPSDR